MIFIHFYKLVYTKLVVHAVHIISNREYPLYIVHVNFMISYFWRVRIVEVCLLQNRLLITHILINHHSRNIETIYWLPSGFLYLFVSSTSTCTTIKICNFIEDNWHEIANGTHQKKNINDTLFNIKVSELQPHCRQEMIDSL